MGMEQSAIAYRKRLEAAAIDLVGIETDIRGNGAGAFLFAIDPAGAVEVSEDSGNVWVEFWRTDSDNSVYKGDYLNYHDALSVVRAWLTP